MREYEVTWEQHGDNIDIIFMYHGSNREEEMDEDEEEPCLKIHHHIQNHALWTTQHQLQCEHPTFFPPCIPLAGATKELLWLVRFEHVDGDVYEGDWLNDKAHGVGSFRGK